VTTRLLLLAESKPVTKEKIMKELKTKPLFIKDNVDVSIHYSITCRKSKYAKYFVLFLGETPILSGYVDDYGLDRDCVIDKKTISYLIDKSFNKEENETRTKKTEIKKR